MSENNDKNWISSVFESITKGFTNVLTSIKEHGWKTALYTFIVLALLWSVILNPIRIGDMVNQQWENHIQNEKVEFENKTEENITRRENANYFVSELMLNIIEKYSNVNRVLLLEKHDSQKNLRGVDFLYSSATYELVNDKVVNPRYLYDDLQKQTNLNLLGSNLIQTLKHRDYIFISDLMKENCNNCRLFRKLKDTGDKQTLIFSFKDSNHRPIIMLIISGEDLDVKSIEDYIKPFKKQIEELLID